MSKRKKKGRRMLGWRRKSNLTLRAIIEVATGACFRTDALKRAGRKCRKIGAHGAAFSRTRTSLTSDADIINAVAFTAQWRFGLAVSVCGTWRRRRCAAEQSASSCIARASICARNWVLGKARRSSVGVFLRANPIVFALPDFARTEFFRLNARCVLGKKIRIAPARRALARLQRVQARFLIVWNSIDALIAARATAVGVERYAYLIYALPERPFTGADTRWNAWAAIGFFEGIGGESGTWMSDAHANRVWRNWKRTFVTHALVMRLAMLVVTTLVGALLAHELVSARACFEKKVVNTRMSKHWDKWENKINREKQKYRQEISFLFLPIFSFF
jgi:hypothetical protein